MAMIDKKTILARLGKAAPDRAKTAWNKALAGLEIPDKSEYSMFETMEIAVAIAQNLQKELVDLCNDVSLTEATPFSLVGEAGIVEQLRNC